MIHCLQGRTWLFVAGIIASGSTSAVFGQGNTFNPYGNSGYADYREFTTPMYSNDPSLPGEARRQSGIGGLSRSNQFSAFTESLAGSGTSADELNSTRGVANGIPYYKAYRLYDKDNRRTYRANDTQADRDFLARLNRRDAEYQKALDEKDPAKRARMLQRIDADPLAQPNTGKGQGTAKLPKSSARITDLPAPRRANPTPSTSTSKTAKAASTSPKPPRPATTPATTATPSTAATPSVDPSTVPIPVPPR